MSQFITSLGIFIRGAIDRRPGIRARDWNEKIVAPAEPCLIRDGVYVQTVRTPRGQIVNISAAAGWRHPWFPSLRWMQDRWEVHLRAGFVNGFDAAVGQLFLLDNPWTPLPGCRHLDGSEGRAIPQFFQRLGVKSARQKVSISAIGGVMVDETEREEAGLPPRQLVACDVWVSVARATYQGVVTVIDASGASGEVVNYEVGYDTAQLERVGARARLQLGPEYPAVRTPTIYERLQGQFTDDGEDRILIATLYFLSPPDATDLVPTVGWQTYTANNCFWNLSHAAKNDPPKDPPAPIRFFSGLAGVWGDVLINQTLSQFNELSDRVFNAVNTTNNEGRFWTA